MTVWNCVHYEGFGGGFCQLPVLAPTCQYNGNNSHFNTHNIVVPVDSV